MKRMNFGAGFDYKEGWTNVDNKPAVQGVLVGDPFSFWQYEDFDFILVNHVLCTMSYQEVDFVLQKLRDTLKPGGKIQVIDVDLLKAFLAYRDNDKEALPAEGGIDERLCLHVSGYSTRKSLYTPAYLAEILDRAGFKDINILQASEYDTRPKESLIVEGIA